MLKHQSLIVAFALLVTVGQAPAGKASGSQRVHPVNPPFDGDGMLHL